MSCQSGREPGCMLYNHCLQEVVNVFYSIPVNHQTAKKKDFRNVGEFFQLLLHNSQRHKKRAANCFLLFLLWPLGNHIAKAVVYEYTHIVQGRYVQYHRVWRYHLLPFVKSASKYGVSFTI